MTVLRRTQFLDMCWYIVGVLTYSLVLGFGFWSVWSVVKLLIGGE